MDRLLVDLRQTWRALAARRGSALATAGVLAIGIGLAATIFAIADPFLLKPLPYPRPGELVIVHIGRGPAAFRTNVDPDVPTFAELQRRTDLFSEFAAYGELERVRLSTPLGAVPLSIRPVSSNLPTLLGAAPPGIETWTPSAENAMRMLLVSPAQLRHRPVAEQLSAPGAAILRAENETLFQIAASLPPGFLFPHARTGARPDALVPARFEGVTWRGERSTGYLTGIARMQTGMTAQAIEAALRGRAEQTGLRITVEPLSTSMSSGVRPLAFGALAVCMLITLVCTANVLNLMIARAVYRNNEFATREALGASRLSMLRLIVFEVSAVALAAVGAALLIARVALAAIAQVIPDRYAAIGEPILTIRVVLFAAALGLTIVAACTLPTWFGARSASMTNAARMQGVESRAIRVFRFLMAAGQTAAAMILLVAAIFLARSYANLWMQDTGYDRDARVLAVSYPPSRTGAALREQIAATLDALRRTPGVTAAAAGIGTGALFDEYSTFGGARIRVGERSVMLAAAQVTPDYFSVVGTRVLAGRAIAESDQGWEAVVINQAFAERFWPGEPPSRIVGQALTINAGVSRVAGVVEGTHDRALDSPPVIRIFRRLDVTGGGPRRVTYAFRAGEAGASDLAMRRAVLAIEPLASIESNDLIAGRLADSVRDRSFAALVLVLFAIAGLSVTATGIFAIVAFVAARRTREIAIRVALGAGSGDVRRLVVRDALVASLAGGLAGLAGGNILSRALASQLYGVEAGDVSVLIAAAAAMLAITGAAAWLPARRALRLDPARALRVQ